MSHSIVIVCLRPGPGLVLADQHKQKEFADYVNDALNAALAPFDENAETEPYKDFEECEPSEWWFVEMLQRSAQDLADGTGVKPYDPNGATWSSTASRQTEDEQRKDMERNAELLRALPAEPTWKDLHDAYRSRYADDDPKEGPQYDAETGRLFEWSRYPRSARNDRGALTAGARWDWWLLGGRWTGYFVVKPAHIGSLYLVGGRPGTMTAANRDHHKIDAAPKGLIDFGAMRAAKGEEAELMWTKFSRIRARYPETLGWSAFRTQVEAKELGIDDARRAYREQPGIEALAAEEDGEFRNSWNCPFDAYARPLAEHRQRAEDAAVPGWSLLTLDGEWWERGKMGWFGMSDSTDESEDAYNAEANAYLDALPDDVILAAVDVHI